MLRPLTAAVAKEDLALNQPRVLDGTEELEPLIRKFEESNGFAPLVLQFTGKTKGSGKDRVYELGYTTDPKRTMWVVREKDELKEVKE